MIITEKVIARDCYDTIRVYDIKYGIEDIIVYSSNRYNHEFMQTAEIWYNEDGPYFTDDYDEITQNISLSELIRVDY